MIFRIVYKSGQIFLPFCNNARVRQTDGRTDRILIANSCLTRHYYIVVGDLGPEN